jgi:hypothetical protein
MSLNIQKNFASWQLKYILGCLESFGCAQDKLRERSFPK